MDKTDLKELDFFIKENPKATITDLRNALNKKIELKEFKQEKKNNAEQLLSLAYSFIEKNAEKILELEEDKQDLFIINETVRILKENKIKDLKELEEENQTLKDNEAEQE